MSSTSLLLLAMYSTVNVVTNTRYMDPAWFPFLMALLMAAAALTCYATLSLLHTPTRAVPRAPHLYRLRHMRGPGERRR